ncbi:hypothetical protein CYG49_00560 [Candidatus Saccharibacteria bacterium]|nr:MAG: hypothetical protein CYG49_00560 [Candidatus Saccharibacteria bacterium]
MIRRTYDHLSHHFGVVRSLATKRVISSFDDEYGLVYFGFVDQHSDEHELIRGVTLSPNHHDRHYSVGAIKGFDVSLVQRTDKVSFPNKPSRYFTWVIMQFDLHVTEGAFPHIFIDAHHHDETFLANLSVKFQQMHHVDKTQFSSHDPLFVKGFNVFTAHADTPLLPYVLTPEVTATLGHHFKHFDFEIQGDKLLVYSSNTMVTRHTLVHMARVGLWLGAVLDSNAATLPQR